MRFLFAIFEGGGNVPPALAITKRLVARGHQVRILGDPCHAHEVEAAGASFASWSKGRTDKLPASDPIRDWEVKSPLALIGRVRDGVMIGPSLGLAMDLQRQLEAWPADAIAINDMLFGPMAAAERSQIPAAILCPNVPLFPMPGLPPVGPGFLPAQGLPGRMREYLVHSLVGAVIGRGKRIFNETRQSLGLLPLDHPLDQLQRLDAALILTSRAFEFPSARPPAGVIYCGPELDDPVWTDSWESPWPDTDDQPMILAGLSTTFQDQAGVLQNIIDAMATLPVRAVVTTGPALASARFKAAPANVHICGSAPHGQLMKRSAVVVSHAGHGVTIRALAAGVPQLCIPMGRDQNDNAARIVYHGAGLKIGAKASTNSIRSAVFNLLADPRFRERAETVGRRVAADAARSPAVEILEALAQRQRGIGDLARGLDG